MKNPTQRTLCRRVDRARPTQRLMERRSRQIGSRSRAVAGRRNRIKIALSAAQGAAAASFIASSNRAHGPRQRIPLSRIVVAGARARG